MESTTRYLILKKSNISADSKAVIRNYVKPHEMGSEMVKKMRAKNQSKAEKVRFYKPIKIISNSTFGAVFKAECTIRGEETSKKPDIVAIKRILVDKKYKNRELKLTQAVRGHPFCIKLRHHYMSEGEPNADEEYANLVFDYHNTNLALLLKSHIKKKTQLDP